MNIVGNKTNKEISKRVLQEKKSTQNFSKNEHFLPLMRTRTEEQVRTFLTPDMHRFGEEGFVYFHNTA